MQKLLHVNQNCLKTQFDFKNKRSVDFFNCVYAMNRQNYDPCQYGTPSLNISPYKRREIEDDIGTHVVSSVPVPATVLALARWRKGRVQKTPTTGSRIFLGKQDLFYRITQSDPVLKLANLPLKVFLGFTRIHKHDRKDYDGLSEVVKYVEINSYPRKSYILETVY